MATDEQGKGGAQRQPLPLPATTTELYLAAILDELAVIGAVARAVKIRMDSATRIDHLLDLGKEMFPEKAEGIEALQEEVPLAPARQAARKKQR